MPRSGAGANFSYRIRGRRDAARITVHVQISSTTVCPESKAATIVSKDAEDAASEAAWRGAGMQPEDGRSDRPHTIPGMESPRSQPPVTTTRRARRGRHLQNTAAHHSRVRRRTPCLRHPSRKDEANHLLLIVSDFGSLHAPDLRMESPPTDRERRSTAAVRQDVVRSRLACGPGSGVGKSRRHTRVRQLMHTTSLQQR